MNRVLLCDCGFEVRAESEVDLVATVRRHAWEAHSMRLTREEALVVAFRAELDEPAPAAIPHRTPRIEKEGR